MTLTVTSTDVLLKMALPIRDAKDRSKFGITLVIGEVSPQSFEI